MLVVTEQYDETGSRTSRYDKRKVTPASCWALPLLRTSVYANYIEAPPRRFTAVTANEAFADKVREQGRSRREGGPWRGILSGGHNVQRLPDPPPQWAD